MRRVRTRPWAPDALIVLLAIAIGGCDGGDGAPAATFLFTFDEGLEGWQAGFADYPAGATEAEQEAIDAFYELDAGHAAMPAPLDGADGGVRLSGNNHSDSLFMFLKRRITGLVPAARYRIELRVVFATDVPRGCFGVGGSPGDSVFVKGGASALEPVRVPDPVAPAWVMNVDKGSQANSGADAQVLGDFANSKDCNAGDFTYELKTLSNADLPALHVTADDDGEAWLLVGTDSGFEGTTTIYYTEIEAAFHP